MLIMKMKKVYICLCLCGNEERFRILERMAEIKENNELLREKYMNALRDLQLIYDNGDIVLNQRTLEKVQMYLQKDNIMQITNKDLL